MTTITGYNKKEKYKTTMTMRGHTLIADEPIELGGQDLGPSPYELLLSGLAACTCATLRMYADRKEWPLEEIKIELQLETEKIENKQTTSIVRRLQFKGALDESQIKRLLDIAGKCPVHNLLTGEVQIDTHLSSK